MDGRPKGVQRRHWKDNSLNREEGVNGVPKKGRLLVHVEGG